MPVKIQTTGDLILQYPYKQRNPVMTSHNFRSDTLVPLESFSPRQLQLIKTTLSVSLNQLTVTCLRSNLMSGNSWLLDWYGYFNKDLSTDFPPLSSTHEETHGVTSGKSPLISLYRYSEFPRNTCFPTWYFHIKNVSRNSRVQFDDEAHGQLGPWWWGIP